jgi:hypothetical protein
MAEKITPQFVEGTAPKSNDLQRILDYTKLIENSLSRLFNHGIIEGFAVTISNYNTTTQILTLSISSGKAILNDGTVVVKDAVTDLTVLATKGVSTSMHIFLYKAGDSSAASRLDWSGNSQVVALKPDYQFTTTSTNTVGKPFAALASLVVNVSTAGTSQTIVSLSYLWVQSSLTHTNTISGTPQRYSGALITNSALALNSITGDRLVQFTITSRELQNYSITTEKIVNDAVTNNHIRDGAVTTNKVADQAITPAKLSPAIPVWLPLFNPDLGVNHQRYIGAAIPSTAGDGLDNWIGEPHLMSPGEATSLSTFQQAIMNSTNPKTLAIFRDDCARLLPPPRYAFWIVSGHTPPTGTNAIGNVHAVKIPNEYAKAAGYPDWLSLTGTHGFASRYADDAAGARFAGPMVIAPDGYIFVSFKEWVQMSSTMATAYGVEPGGMGLSGSAYLGRGSQIRVVLTVLKSDNSGAYDQPNIAFKTHFAVDGNGTNGYNYFGYANGHPFQFEYLLRKVTHKDEIWAALTSNYPSGSRTFKVWCSSLATNA